VLNKPKPTGLGEKRVLELCAVVRKATAHPDLRVVLLCGLCGPRQWCCRGDIDRDDSGRSIGTVRSIEAIVAVEAILSVVSRRTLWSR